MVSKEADVIRAAEALKAIKALVEANQTVDEDVLTLDAVVWRAPNETLQDDEAMVPVAPPTSSVAALQAAVNQLSVPATTETAVHAPDAITPIVADTPLSSATIIAETSPTVVEDPYAIFDLDTPVVTSRLGAAEAIDAELPTERSADLARAALREQREQRVEGAGSRPLAPSPVLQPTAERAMPDVSDGASYADFSMDEHEAMMSTPLPTALSRQQNAAPNDNDDAPADNEGGNVTPQLAPDLIARGQRDAETRSAQLGADSQANTEIKPNSAVEQMSYAEPEQAENSKIESQPTAASSSGSTQIPLHVVADNGVQEGDEINSQEVMRTALRSMIRDQIGNWLEDNINDLIEDALREPSSERTTAPARKSKKNNNPND